MKDSDPPSRSFLEFFAGGGMARLGLAAGWRCLFANDVDAKKCASYRANFGGEHLIEADIASLTRRSLPERRADLAWASFPCQDLSLAGARTGLSGARSGLFFEFMRLIAELRAGAPRLIVLENVCGLLTSHGGADFRAIVEALIEAGYIASALVIDAKAFTPQSRPRLFIFGFRDGGGAFGARPSPDEFTPRSLIRSIDALPAIAVRRWRWLGGRLARTRNVSLADVLDADADWSRAAGARALALMSAQQRTAADALLKSGDTHIGAAFRRIRIERGRRVQRLEARFDGLAGCLRTPAGGSSRQILLRIEGGEIFARLLNPREAARLMGVPDDYLLPEGATDALRLVGDGVCAPVVRWIAEEILAPALSRSAAAAA